MNAKDANGDQLSAEVTPTDTTATETETETETAIPSGSEDQSETTSRPIPAAEGEDAPPPLRFVGIASSAGGLEAVSLLAQNLPKEANAVYVVAQHMSPTHKSLLTSLISRETKLQVLELQEETFPQPDTIYVTPPNSDVIYDEGVLRLREPNGHLASPKPNADRLFKSLAEGCRENCVGIVLSGTGSDGSYGVQSIREAGGITIAQDPASAKYDGMPSSASETGCIDLTLSPDQIGQHLEKILARPRNLDSFRQLAESPNPLSELFGILMARTRVDFADYKQNTLNRRIARRMTALGVDDYESYLDFCRTDVSEVDALHRDLLISVTRFFRDPEQFAKLRGELSQALRSRRGGPIRIWVVGCATGEEAYSIAITITELLGGVEALAKQSVQVFATDIDQNAIEVARKGVYPMTAAQDIPSEYLNDYFLFSDTNITVRREIRAITMFSHHNVFQDPPFVNVDLVSIRNVLIYFNLALQERVLSRLHYSLTSEGLLFLGTSETVGEMSIFFDVRDGADKVFVKRRGLSGELSMQPGIRVFDGGRRGVAKSTGAGNAEEMGLSFDMALARVVAPNGFICTKNGSIIEVLGDISSYIEIRAGAATSLNVRMLREPLKTEVSSLVAIAIRNEQRRDGRWHAVALPAGNRLQMQAFPFAARDGGEIQCLVAINARFEEQPEIQLENLTDNEQRAYVERMEREVRTTQEALQQTIEELQTANEELQLANEEMQSTNEEFQATNEELETSNEELQSTNEELLTVNEELQVSAAERLALASELEATMASAPYVVVLADQALILRRVSNAGLKFFGLDALRPTGMHLSQCDLPAGFPALAPIANNVLKLQEAARVPVLSDGQYYSMVMSPVHDSHKKLIGLSITISQYDGEPLARILEMVGQVSNIAYWTYNLDTEEVFWSPEMHRIFDHDPSEPAPNWSDIPALIHSDDREAEEKALGELIAHGGTYSSQKRIQGKDGWIRTVNGSTIAIDDAYGQPFQLTGVVWDNTQAVEHEIRISHLEAVQDDLGIGFYSYDAEGTTPVWSDATYRILGYDRAMDSPSVENMLRVISEDERDSVSSLIQQALVDGGPFEVTAPVICAGRVPKTCTITGLTEKSADGSVSRLYGSIRDIEKRDTEKN